VAKGDRVKLEHCSDPYSDIQPGATGTVTFVDDLGTQHVSWDDGRKLGLVPAAGDRWTVIGRVEVEEGR
jgi:Domain of unknown function (DUF4314)